MKIRIVALLIVVGILPSAAAQDAQLLRVVIPNGLTINALSDNQTRDHSLDGSDVDFFESDWTVGCNRFGGATATFTAAPFANNNDPTSLRDVNLRITSLENGSLLSRLLGIQWPWVYETREAQSDYAAGQNSAAVGLTSSFVGGADLSLRVRFITGDVDTLVSGTYSTTVVGTITAN